MAGAARARVQILFYVSGHGLGHASRDAEVIRAIARLAPSAAVAARSSAPSWIFNERARPSVELTHAEVDTGVAQIDSLRLDEEETARRASRFYSDFSRRVDHEAAIIVESGARAIVGDIPPLAFAAAARAQVPSIALANFTWDWIYEGYPSFGELAPGTIDVIRSAYACTTRALRLPLYGGFEPMAAVVEDIPLIARHARRPREETRKMLDLDDGIVALASFGGHGVDLPYAGIAKSGRFTLLLTDYEDRQNGGPRNLRRLDRKQLAERGVQYADLVAAADVVVSKPGYGIVSECLANGPALLYTDRGRFREHDVFVGMMPRLLRCRHISQDDLRAGRWGDAIDALLAQDPPPERLPTNGADVAARIILDVAER
jgi:UDP:flavonoid glycosyltransferase YjiC (YdhE family)